MSNQLKEAIVVGTTKAIKVYKLKSGMWCDFADCRTTYREDQLKFI